MWQARLKAGRREIEVVATACVAVHTSFFWPESGIKSTTGSTSTRDFFPVAMFRNPVTTPAVVLIPKSPALLKSLGCTHCTIIKAETDFVPFMGRDLVADI